jgi:hypothetical protein
MAEAVMSATTVQDYRHQDGTSSSILWTTILLSIELQRRKQQMHISKS